MERKKFEISGGKLITHDVLPRFPRYDAILVNVPTTLVQGPTDQGDYPSFGLGRIASTAINNFGLNVGIFDTQRIEKDGQRISLLEIKKQLEVLNPNIVGLNPTSINVEAALQIAQILDQLNIPYVLGGVYATLSTQQTLELFTNAKAVVKGKGEIAFSKIIQCLKENLPLQQANIPGVFTHDYTPTQTRAEKFNSEDWPIIDQEALYYQPFERQGDKVKARLYETEGCPENCGFCCSPVLNERKYRRPTIQKIVDDTEAVIKLGANRIHYLDDLLFTNPKQIAEFYNELKKRNLLGKFDWHGMVRADMISKWPDETIKQLKETGCFFMSMGVETGSKRVLEFINKGISPEQVLSATKKLIDNDIGVKGFFIFGFPTETEEETLMTKQLALQMAHLGATQISAFQFQPYPGTQLWDFIQKHKPGLLDNMNSYTMQSLSVDQIVKTVRRTAVWLPDNIQISEISNTKVRSFVNSTIEEFYQIVKTSTHHKSWENTSHL